MKYNIVFASEQPVSVKIYVMNGFPRLSIAFAEKTVTSDGTGYLVSLNDSTELLFSPSGSCSSVYDPHQDFQPVMK